MDLSSAVDVRETNQIGERTRERVVGIRHMGLKPDAVAWTGIEHVGVSDAAEGFSFATERGWKRSQALVCFRGRGEVRLGGRWVECRRGQAYLTPAGRPHAYRAVAGARWGVCWVICNPATGRLPLDELPEPVLAPVSPGRLLWPILALYEEALGRGEPAVMHRLVEVLRLQVERLGGGASDRLESLWAAVDADLARPWTVAELAERACMSGEHLRRLCRAQLGRAVMEQVTYLRMRRAASLLRTTRLTVEAVAQAVGYADRYGFAAAFRRWAGASPGRYRRAGQ